jgi:hypothetical protein
MDGQLQFGVPALEAINVSCWWDFPTGWTLRITARRSGRSWAGGETREYDYLTTDELGDVLAAELGRLLDS